MHRIESDKKMSLPNITAFDAGAIAAISIIAGLLAWTIQSDILGSQNYQLTDLWLPGSVTVLTAASSFYWKRLQRIEKVKKIGNEIVKVSKEPGINHSKKLAIELHSQVLEYLEFRDGLSFVSATKELYYQDDIFKDLATKLGREENDELQPRQYIQKFGSETGSLRQYFPKKDLLGFASKSSTTDLMKVINKIPYYLDSGIEMMSKFLLLWADKTAQQEVDHHIADCRQYHLVWGAQKGHVVFLKLMLAHKALIDVGNEGYKGNALHLASQNGSMRCVQFLIENGAQVNATDSGGDTALIYAVNNDQIAVSQYLLQNGIDIQHSNNKGNKAIHCATTVDTMTLLVNFGANLLDRNNKNETAICRYGQLNLKDVHDAAINLLLANQS